jgi:alkanesulfonate monooxygenase SsuD/methylene tetrahydromethanopterin reductase-like flavin-dependent oxidoreductase (luciferase family)
MKFGLFYEHQLPRPWGANAERDLFHNALTQIELADRLGFDYVWTVEHHFLEEYAHSTAPEVFLGAVSQRTKNIRLGHGVMLMVPGINHPARCAERIATLDLLSDGRVEWGTGESGSAAELQGFGIDIDEKRAAWREGVEQCARMLAMTPYPGHQGRFFSMPPRNVVPKPIQRPHPPLWMGCTNAASVHYAAQVGVGALFFQFAGPEAGRKIVEDYYETFKRECVPIGLSVNPNICFMYPLSIHRDHDVAVARGADGYGFFSRTLAHYFGDWAHVPGRSDIAAEYQLERDAQESRPSVPGIGTPDEILEHLRLSEEIGIDQVGFVQASGGVEHAHILEGLQLFADEVMGKFKARDAQRQARKAEELAPYIEAAMKRREPLRQLDDHAIPTIPTLMRQAREAHEAGAALTKWQREALTRIRGLFKTADTREP